MRSIMRKVFDCTLGALWRLYVKMLVYELVDVDHDLDFASWVAAIAVTLSFICAISVAFIVLLLLVTIAIDFPLPVICCIIGIAVICILPWLALKSYRSSKAKARASFLKAVKTARARASKKGFNQ